MPSSSTWIRLGVILTGFVGLPVYWTLNPPLLPIATANGAYRNSCCEPIILNEGEMRFSGTSIAEYQVEEDKQGPYVFTKRYVGFWNGRIRADANRYPLKLRLNTAGACKYLDIPSERELVRFSSC